MDILTPELIDLARDRGSAFVAVAVDGELLEYAWDSTDARWEEILEVIAGVVDTHDPLYVGVVTEGMTVDNQTYDMKEHLTVAVVHQAGYTAYRVPMASFNALVDTDPMTTLDPPVEELEFDYEALKAVLPW